MKRIMLMVISMIALSAAIGCNTKTKSSSKTDADCIQVDSMIQQFDKGIGDSLKAELEKAGIEDLDAAIEGFFTDAYNEKYYEDEDFIKKYCTEKLQKKLKDAYEYDAEEDGYATWKFRSDAQDGPNEEHKLTRFTPEGNGWYKYEFIDMGIRGSHRIKFVIHVTPRNVAEFYIDELE